MIFSLFSWWKRYSTKRRIKRILEKHEKHRNVFKELVGPHFTDFTPKFSWGYHEICIGDFVVQKNLIGFIRKKENSNKHYVCRTLDFFEEPYLSIAYVYIRDFEKRLDAAIEKVVERQKKIQRRIRQENEAEALFALASRVREAQEYVEREKKRCRDSS